MPNWCETKIFINYENEKKLKQLESKINSWMQTNYLENDFGREWLGNIVGNSGIGTVNENPEFDVRCRGWLEDMRVEDNQHILQVETAWIPMLNMWVLLLDKYLPDAEIIYRAEECGMGIYDTNDPSLVDKYFIDAWGEYAFETSWEADENHVIEFLQKLLKSNEEDIDKLLECFSGDDRSDEISINKWNYVDVSYYCE